MIAFDLSLTATGWAAPTSAGVESGVLTPPKGMRGTERLRWIRGQVLDRAWQFVVLEGYGFAPGRGHAAREMAELGGVVRVALADAGIPYVDVPPASLKKYATGKGNAGKNDVLAEAIRRLGYGGADHNEADALWLLQMGLAWYGLALVVDVPKAHRAALEGVDWLDPVRWLDQQREAERSLRVVE